MGRVKKGGSSMRQKAYALRVWGGKDENKRQVALDVGYSPSVANSPRSKIEIHKGFNNAMSALAEQSNNLAAKIMFEFQARKMDEFSNKDLIGALNAIGQAWGKFNAGAIKVASLESQKAGANKLRTIILQRVENQTIEAPVRDVTPETPVPEEDF